ncbi:hypothetical protein [Lacinutrix mariniflava]|uniref:hypothetical protein n=1 Tax=Lacinutrix mariniflava TaxID=342955 RepID=UPI0006E24C61|nr:hypothetical protein [Lacinutrix mariniflava]
MIKKIVFGILILGVIAIIGYLILMANFDIFNAPTETELKLECDDSGLRKITMYEVSGNATTNKSILIKSSDCNAKLYSDELINPELIFSATLPNIKNSDVNFEWRNFDTITIRYNKKLRILKMESESSTLNPKITFEYIAQ